MGATTLYSEQSVTIDVEAPDGASDADLRRLAYEGLDAGTVFWNSDYGEVTIERD